MHYMVMRPTPRVNWGHGRLVPYETIESLTAKFCAVNGLKPLRAWDFLAQAAGLNNRESSGHKEEHAELAVKAIAALLDEPIEVVRTVFSNSLNLPACFGTFKIDSDRPGWSDITYCPDCITHGFHGSFHIQAWFSRCLVHGTRLKSSSEGLYTAGSLFGRRVAALAKLYYDAGVLTKPPPVHAVHDNYFHDEVIVKVQPYETWIARIRTVCQTYSKSHLWANGNQHYLPQHAEFLFSRLDWIAAIPQEVNAALNTHVKGIEPKIVRFNKVEAQAFLTFTKQTSFDDLLWFYRETHAFLDKDSAHRLHAKHAVNAMRESHPGDQCKCSWGWDRRINGWSGMWFEVSPNGWPYWLLNCPHEVAQERLEDKWIKFLPKDMEWSRPRTRAQYIDEYWRELGRFEKQGLVSKIERKELAQEPVKSPSEEQRPSNGFWADTFESVKPLSIKRNAVHPDVQLKLPDKLNSVVEKVLEADLELDIGFYKRWLALIERGESLNNCSHYPASINIFCHGDAPQICNGGLTMMSWPVISP